MWCRIETAMVHNKRKRTFPILKKNQMCMIRYLTAYKKLWIVNEVIIILIQLTPYRMLSRTKIQKNTKVIIEATLKPDSNWLQQ